MEYVREFRERTVAVGTTTSVYLLLLSPVAAEVQLVYLEQAGPAPAWGGHPAITRLPFRWQSSGILRHF